MSKCYGIVVSGPDAKTWPAISEHAQRDWVTESNGIVVKNRMGELELWEKFKSFE